MFTDKEDDDDDDDDDEEGRGVEIKGTLVFGIKEEEEDEESEESVTLLSLS